MSSDPTTYFAKTHFAKTDVYRTENLNGGLLEEKSYLEGLCYFGARFRLESSWDKHCEQVVRLRPKPAKIDL